MGRQPGDYGQFAGPGLFNGGGGHGGHHGPGGEGAHRGPGGEERIMGQVVELMDLVEAGWE